MTQEQTPETPQEEQHPLAGLKVVVTILEDNAALIGLSRGAVDPHVEPCAISAHDDLASILSVVPEVLERALQRWERQPRFPAAPPPAATPARTPRAQTQGTGRRTGRTQPQDPNVQTPQMF